MVDAITAGRKTASAVSEALSVPNYLSRADANCSYDGMAGIARRWLVIEGDKRTLEQQLWIHTAIDAATMTI